MYPKILHTVAAFGPGFGPALMTHFAHFKSWVSYCQIFDTVRNPQEPDSSVCSHFSKHEVVGVPLYVRWEHVHPTGGRETHPIMWQLV